MTFEAWGLAAMLMATLIAVFITSEGIFIGADTSVSNESGLHLVRPKYCQTGPQSVMTLQGQYYFEDKTSGAVSALYNIFRLTCDKYRVSGGRRTIADQAESFTETLRSDFARYLAATPPAEFALLYPDTLVVTRLTVAGYDGAQPVVVTRGLGATGSAATKWDARTAVLPRLTVAQCGVRFQGEEAVIAALKGNDARIPAAERDRPELLAIQSGDGDCAKLDFSTARAAFLAAVRLTVQFGPQFEIRPGSVGSPLDLLYIRPDGVVTSERIHGW